MEELKFKCSVCNSFVEMKHNVPEGFAGWAYTEMDWSDFDENVPSLSDDKWERSDNTPKAGEMRTIRVHKPFNESAGNVFYMLFEPALIFFNGWDDYPYIIDKCAISECKLEKILLFDKYKAWIRVKILNSVPIKELYKTYSPFYIESEFEEYKGICKCDRNLLINERWQEVYWSDEGDIGENKKLFIDENGVKHLVLFEFWDIHDDIVYFGNIVKK